ncbi:hypothetical protein GCM10010517_76860 [Streptosporangium fragile]|uniref:Uncharacterized protein n=1 Tax=Streptosporangium fragile TaxID=46186 RepID=A0ABN3WE48_9ACTN
MRRCEEAYADAVLPERSGFPLTIDMTERSGKGRERTGVRCAPIPPAVIETVPYGIDSQS